MKIGMLLICCDNEKDITAYQFTKLLKQNDANICFVNNASKDKTLDVLKMIQEDSKTDVSIVDIKKDRGLKAAIKAGVRYLVSKNELRYILYVKIYKLEDFQRLTAIFNLIKNRKYFIQKLLKESNKKVAPNVFSVDDILKEVS
jgi:hypothetical protein